MKTFETVHSYDFSLDKYGVQSYTIGVWRESGWLEDMVDLFGSGDSDVYAILAMFQGQGEHLYGPKKTPFITELLDRIASLKGVKTIEIRDERGAGVLIRNVPEKDDDY